MQLLQPIRISNLELKHRMIMAPMGAELGDFDRRSNAYYVRRAQGGAAMILVNVAATRALEGDSPSALLDQTSYDGFARLVEAVHRHGSRLCVQIMPGTGLGGMAEGRTQPIGASAIPLYPGANATFAELTHDEILLLLQAVGNTVRLAQRAGADAVELHAYGGYLTDRFMTERWNIRKDEYGGSFDNRMRFLKQLIAAVQEEAGEDFPLIVKYTPTHCLPVEAGYRGLDEGLDIARMLERCGVHALHVDVGCHDNWHLAMPPIYQQEAAVQLGVARQVRQVTNLPVICHGRLGDVSKAEHALREGCLDIVGIGRGLLADPDLPNKVAEGRPRSIRACISCNEGCIKSVSEGRHIDCAVNPLTGYELDKALVPTKHPRRVLVIGAGPGGCQAALSARQAGHEVELWEKTDRLGGNFHTACQPPFKRDGGRLLAYYAHRLQALDIPVHYGREATADSVLAHAPEVVIVATGSRPIRPAGLPGLDLPQVCTAGEVLEHLVPLGDRILIAGGGLVGCETAVTLAQRGKEVTLIELADRLLPEPLFIMNHSMLSALLAHPNITPLVKTRLLSVEQSGAAVERDGVTETLPCDNVVLAMGYRADDALYRALVQALPQLQVFNIGDSVQSRKVLDAVREAHDAVLALG